MGVLDDAIREHLDLKRKRGADPSEIERLEREALGPVRRDPTAYPLDAARPPSEESRTEPAETQHDRDEPQSDRPRRGFLWRRRKSRPTEPEPEWVEPEPEFAAAEPQFTEPDPRRAEADDLDPDRVTEAHDLGTAPAGAVPGAESPTTPEAEPPRLTFDSPPPTRPRFTDEATGTPPDEDDGPASPPSAESPDTDDGHGPGRTRPSSSGAAHEHSDSFTTTARGDAAVGRQGATREWDVESTFERDDPPDNDNPSEDDEPDDMLDETPDFLLDTPEHDRLWFEQRPPQDFDFGG